MLKKLFFIILFTTYSVLDFLSCNSNPLSPEYYDGGSFYYYQNGKIKLYTSNSIMLLKFEDNVSLNVAKNLLKKYHLEFYSEIYSSGTNIDTLINRHDIIVIKIQSVRNSINNYKTMYPKVNHSSTNFGNLKEVEYFLPSYTTDGSQNNNDRVFITEDILFKVNSDNISIENILQKYKLKLIPKEYLGENVYFCELTENSPKDPLSIANEIHEESNIEWSSPDFIFFGWQE
ncbi:MAG: hypothetical protein WAR79_15215 [Melioribacteraceae bacterium]